MVGLQSALVPK
jgi:hypothetical protein